MTLVQRVLAVVDGKLPDRPPVSFWHHFPPGQVAGAAAVAAHVAHVQAYDLDFLKVMNDNPYPHHAPVQVLADLSSILALRGDEAEFQAQLDLLADLRRELRGGVLLTTTLFNSWTVLRHLIRPPTEHNPPDLSDAADAPSQRINQWLAQDEPAVTQALQNIAQSLGAFAGRCLAAGADGVFLSVRDDWIGEGPDSSGRTMTIVHANNRQILAGAAGGRFNMLHVCGHPVDLRAYSDYPVHAINWADRAAGPSISEVRSWMKPAICGGVDNLATLPKGAPADVEREVADAIRQAGDRPLIVTPGCTYDPGRVPRENLHALSRAVHAARY